MNKQLVSFCLLLGVIGAGCTSNRNVEAPLPQAIEAGSFVEKWQAQLDIGKSQVEALYLRENTIFAYGKDRLIYLLDRNSGRLVKVDDVGARSLRVGPPILLKQEVAYPLATSLTIVDRVGHTSREFVADMAIRTPGVASGDTVFVGGDMKFGPHVVAFDTRAHRQVPKWIIRTTGSFEGSPALHQGILYVGSEDGMIYAMNTDGEAAWPLNGSAFKTAGAITTDIQADDFGVYCASTDGTLYCLDRGSGKIKWRYFGGSPLHTSPAVTARSVYQYVPRVGLVSVNKTSGDLNRKPAWVLEDGRQFLAADQKYAYVRLKDNRIAACDLETGAIAFKTRKNDFRLFVTNPIDSTIYAATRDGKVFAVTPELRSGTYGKLVFQPVVEDKSQG